MIAFVFAWRLIQSRASGTAPPLDRAGFLLTGTGLAALTYSAHVIAEPSPSWTLVIVLGVAAAVLLTAAAWHLLRTPAPLVNLRVLRIPTLGNAMAGNIFFWLVVGAIPFLLTLLFQDVFGWSPAEQVVMLPLTFMAGTFVPIAGMALVPRTIAEWNPLSPLVAALRELTGGPPSVGGSWPLDHPIAGALMWSAILLAVCVPVALVRFRKLTED